MLEQRGDSVFWFLPYTIGAYKLADNKQEQPSIDPENVRELLKAFKEQLGLDTNPEAS